MKLSRRFMAGMGAALAGTIVFFGFACNKAADSAQAAPSPGEVQKAPAEPQKPVGRLIAVAVTNDGFAPSKIEVKKGETVTLRFTRSTKSECLKAIAIPDLKIEKDLPMDTPVDVVITPEKEGPMVLQCWMAMVKATIQVSGS